VRVEGWLHPGAVRIAQGVNGRKVIGLDGGTKTNTRTSKTSELHSETAEVVRSSTGHVYNLALATYTNFRRILLCRVATWL
jgi:hypothetical protein